MCSPVDPSHLPMKYHPELPATIKFIEKFLKKTAEEEKKIKELQKRVHHAAEHSLHIPAKKQPLS